MPVVPGLCSLILTIQITYKVQSHRLLRNLTKFDLIYSTEGITFYYWHACKRQSTILDKLLHSKLKKSGHTVHSDF